MEKLSPITQHMQLPLDIPLPLYLQDHRFMGKAVFPAVEAMRILAESLHSLMPKIHLRHIFKADFDRFLLIPPDQKKISAIHDMEIRKDGEIVSKLITRSYSEKTGITRVKEHVALHFSADELPQNIKSEMPETVRGEDRFEIPCERIYAELVPFGPAYQNITGSLILTEKDAVADVQGCPKHLFDCMADFSYSPLGSPFPADAAFHAACAWGQRYAGIVAFPVGLKARHIIRPTSLHELYKARCIPVKYDEQLLFFDIYLYDQMGNICEIMQDLHMRDISRGRMKAPEWVQV
ncbi:MAG: polyketide synthase dehydratase domain-containing protein [Desulfococcaceae bacterium]